MVRPLQMSPLGGARRNTHFLHFLLVRPVLLRSTLDTYCCLPTRNTLLGYSVSWHEWSHNIGRYSRAPSLPSNILEGTIGNGRNVARRHPARLWGDSLFNIPRPWCQGIPYITESSALLLGYSHPWSCFFVRAQFAGRMACISSYSWLSEVG